MRLSEETSTFQFGNTINWVINQYYFRIFNLCVNCLYYIYMNKHCSRSLAPGMGIAVFVNVQLPPLPVVSDISTTVRL